MISRPPLLGGTALIVWRLDPALRSQTWNSGEGALRHGGRWNSKGRRAVYCSLDPSTAILEIAVHTGFRALDLVAHVLTSATITDPADVHVVMPSDVPNPNWLRPGIPSAGQQSFGDTLLDRYKFIALPSTVSIYSWNVIFSPVLAAGGCPIRSQETFALDTRLHPPTP